MAKTDPEREKRLAQALRDNLRRRKAQGRTGASAERDGNGDRQGNDQADG